MKRMRPQVELFSTTQKSEILESTVRTFAWLSTNASDGAFRHDPWGQWFDHLVDAQSGYDTTSAIDACEAWLTLLDNPYAQEVQLLKNLNPSTKAIGTWLESKILNKELSEQPMSLSCTDFSL